MMSTGYVTALRGECYVTLRSTVTYVVVLLPAVTVLIGILLAWSSESREIAQAALLGQEPTHAGEVSTAYGHFVDGMARGIAVAAYILIAFAAWTISQDCHLGVVRHAVTQSVDRRAYVLAKLSLSTLFACVSLAVMIGIAYAASGLIWDFEPVVEEGFEIIGEREIQAEIRFGVLLAVVPIFAVLGLGTLVGVALRSPMRATASSVVGLAIFDIFKADFGSASHYIFATYLPSISDQSHLADVARLVRGYSDVYVDQGLIQLNLWVPIPETIVLVVCCLIFITRVKL